MLIVRTQGYAPPPTNGVQPIPQETNNKELAVMRKVDTAFITRTAVQQQQADNRANITKILVAAGIIALGFYLLDKRG